jgi:hypothetical protein
MAQRFVAVDTPASHERGVSEAVPERQLVSSAA